MAQARGLGKGLSALLGEQQSVVPINAANKEGFTQNEIAISDISAWKDQPRQNFDEGELNELADSIKKNGVVQPIIVRKSKQAGKYEIVAGERRWRASQITGLQRIPAIVIDVSDERALEIALVENIQRADLKPLEMAESYQKLIDEYDYTQEQLSEVIGKSRPQITNTLRLLSLPEKVKELLNKDKLSAGHARTLVGSKFAEEIAERIVKNSLNVRQAESLMKKLAEEKSGPRPASSKSEEIVEAENTFSKVLGTKISISDKGGQGTITISYKTADELYSILGRFKKNK